MQEDGVRVGFEAVSSVGDTATMASIHTDSDVRVSRYGVDIDGFNSFLDELPEPVERQLLYVDEIGQMQLHFDHFKSLVERWLSLDNPFVGTITKVFEDDFTSKLRDREDVAIIEVDAENRDELAGVLGTLVVNVTLLPRSGTEQSAELTRLIRKYSESRSYTQLRKLFKNALVYVAEGKVNKQDDGSYIVEGYTDPHKIEVVQGGHFSCDCDLFNGRGQYESASGECSHIQSVLLVGGNHLEE